MNRTEEKVDELREMLGAELGAMEMDVTTSYTLADAIREGSKVSEQAHGWGQGDKMCAMHAAVAAAAARGYMG